MPALQTINEEVGDIFDPFSLVNYEELDDYLLKCKAKHKPEIRRISVDDACTFDNTEQGKASLSKTGSKSGNLLQQSCPSVDFSSY